jgi:Holliday junction resolvase RusA-like endonuclease
VVVVEGKIKGKARPRVFNGHAMTPKDTVSYENWVKTCYQQQCNEYTKKPIKADIYVYYQIPKSYSKSKRDKCIKNLIRPTKKPDADNVAKIILDSLNGIAYKDDTQIVDLRVYKYFTEDKERVEFQLYEMMNVESL